LEKVSIGKNVPNLISYLHEVVHNFSQSPDIYFELIFFRVNFNSEITDERAPPVRRRAGLRGSAPMPQLKAAVGTVRRASRQLP
jgi:hypothetical protein